MSTSPAQPGGIGPPRLRKPDASQLTQRALSLVTVPREHTRPSATERAAALAKIDAAVGAVDASGEGPRARADALAALAVVALKNDLEPRADALFEEAHGLDPAHLDARLGVAQTHLRAGRAPQAVALLEGAGRIRPEIAFSFHFTRGRALVGTKDFDGARKAFTAALIATTNHANRALVMVEEGRASVLEGHLEAAHGFVKRALGFDPDSRAAATFADELRRVRQTAPPTALFEPTPRERALAQFRYAQGELDGKPSDYPHLAQAERYLRSALALLPDHPVLHLAMADVTVRLGRAADAEAALGHVLKAFPAHADVLATLGQVALAQKDSAVARERFERVIAIAPGHAFARLVLGHLGLKALARDPALREPAELARVEGHLRAATQVGDPDQRQDARFGLAYLELLRNEPTLAEEQLRQVRVLKDDPRKRVLSAAIAAFRGNPERAQELLQADALARFSLPTLHFLKVLAEAGVKREAYEGLVAAAQAQSLVTEQGVRALTPASGRRPVDLDAARAHAGEPLFGCIYATPQCAKLWLGAPDLETATVAA